MTFEKPVQETVLSFFIENLFTSSIIEKIIYSDLPKFISGVFRILLTFAGEINKTRTVSLALVCSAQYNRIKFSSSVSLYNLEVRLNLIINKGHLVSSPENGFQSGIFCQRRNLFMTFEFLIQGFDIDLFLFLSTYYHSPRQWGTFSLQLQIQILSIEPTYTL